MTSRPSYKTEVAFISPAEANRLIRDCNGPNRPISKATVRRYAASMKAGRWDTNAPSVIVIDTNGHVRDGQHRLEAIALSGVGQWFIVANDMPPASFAVLDTGAKRTASQVLATQGVAYAAVVASAARYALNYIDAVGLRLARDNDELAEFVAAHPGLQPLAGKCHPVRKLFGPSPFTAVMYLASQHASGVMIERFIEGVARPNDTSFAVGDPRLMLRTWAERELSRQGGAIIRPEPLMMATSLAWNAFHAGKGFDRPAQLTSKQIASRATMPIVGFEPITARISPLKARVA